MDAGSMRKKRHSMRRASLALAAALTVVAAFACIASESGRMDEKFAPIFGVQLPH
jgi:hypothetical protein